MNCSQCGETVTKTALVCPRCGTKLESREVEMEKVNTKIDDTRFEEKWGMAGIIAGFIAIAVGIWLGFYFTETHIEWQGPLHTKSQSIFTGHRQR